jgi:phosphohistidine phosphatase SixA
VSARRLDIGHDRAVTGNDTARSAHRLAALPVDTWEVAHYTRCTIVVTLAASTCCLVVVIGLSLSTAAAAQGTDAVWEALRAPGSVVVLRHSYAPGTFDPPDARLDDCSTQRNLDEAGRAQARRIGEAFRQRGIEVGAVLSSPRCRCLDTARLAFGRVQPWGVLQGALRDAGLRQRLLAETRRTIAAHESGPPLVLVTHGSVVTDLTGLNIPMGAFVVLRRGPDGRHTVGGQLLVE